MAAYFANNGCVIPGTIESYTSTKICPKCNKEFKSEITEQIEGFRERSNNDCPYCGYVIESSMSWEYYNTEC